VLQIDGNGMYLTDDHNTAVFPDDSGDFVSYQLASSSHYEVHGSALNSDEQQRQSPNGFQFVQRTPLQPLSSTPATSSAPPFTFRRTSYGPKTFQR